MEDEKETMPLGTPRSKLASNDMHQTLMGLGFIDALPSHGVKPTWGFHKVKLRKVETWRHAPGFQLWKGVEGRVGSPGIRLGEGLVDQAWICIKTNHPRG
jgi:hypothetical protein